MDYKVLQQYKQLVNMWLLDNMSYNLIYIKTIKYLRYICVSVWWLNSIKRSWTQKQTHRDSLYYSKNFLCFLLDCEKIKILKPLCSLSKKTMEFNMHGMLSLNSTLMFFCCLCTSFYSLVSNPPILARSAVKQLFQVVDLGLYLSYILTTVSETLTRARGF